MRRQRWVILVEVTIEAVVFSILDDIDSSGGSKPALRGASTHEVRFDMTGDVHGSHTEMQVYQDPSMGPIFNR